MKKTIIWILTPSISFILLWILNQNPEIPTPILLGSVMGGAVVLMATPFLLTGITYYLEKFFRKETKVNPFENTFLGWWVVIVILTLIGRLT